jgi:hypothetical protein
MFVNSKDIINVTLFWKRNEKTGRIAVLRNLDGLDEDGKKAFTSVTFKMRPMSWGLYNELQREATFDKLTGDGAQLDWVKYKENKLLKLISEWDAKGKDDKIVPINPETIKSLHPLIAELALVEYDKQSLVDEE